MGITNKKNIYIFQLEMGGCFDCVQQGVDAIKAGEIGKLGLLSITTVHGWNYIVRSSSVHITHIVPMCYIPSSFLMNYCGKFKNQ